jgi:hypothetical protein
LLEGGFAAAAVILGGARIAATSSFAARGASSTPRSCGGSLLNFELDDEQQLLLYLQALLHILKISPSS